MRLIDADALFPYGSIPFVENDGFATADKIYGIIKSAPTIEAEPVKHGRWEWFEEWIPSTSDHPKECEDCGWRCGRCKRSLEDMVGGYWDDPTEKPELNFCPSCGATMIKENKG